MPCLCGQVAALNDRCGGAELVSYDADADASDAGASTHDLLAQAEQGEIAVMPSPRGELVIDHAAPPPPPHSPPRAVAPPVRMTTEARLMQERAAQLATAGASQSGGLYSTAI